MKKYQPDSASDHSANSQDLHGLDPKNTPNIFEQLFADYLHKNVGTTHQQTPFESNSANLSSIFNSQSQNQCCSAMIDSLMEVVESQAKFLESLSAKVEEVV